MKVWIDFEVAKKVRGILFMEGIGWATSALYNELNQGAVSFDGKDCEKIVLALEKTDLEQCRHKVLVRI